jgi:hypothetical protein
MPNLNNDPNQGPDEEPFEKAEFSEMGEQKPPPEDVPRPEDRDRTEDVTGGKAQQEDVADVSADDLDAGDFWSQLGLPNLSPPKVDPWTEEKYPADKSLLLRHMRNELTPEENDYVILMLSKYEHWERALADLILKEGRL